MGRMLEFKSKKLKALEAENKRKREAAREFAKIARQIESEEKEKKEPKE